MEQPKKVYTPLGQGSVVYELKDGSFVVEFDHGGGHIFTREELFPNFWKKKVRHESQGNSA